MKKFLLIFSMAALFALLFSFPCYAAPADDGYYYDSVDATVHVNLDNSVDVVKDVRVYYTQERHGIYFDMLTNWDNTRLKYSGIKVEGAPYEVQHNAGYIRLKIGDPDYTVTGYMDYTIRYSINMGKDHTTKLDALYMNILEHELQSSVQSFTFKVVLPKSIEPDYIGVFVGGTAYESSDNPVVYHYFDDTLSGSTTRPLTAYEGVTVKIDLPEGYFSEARDPYALQKMLAWIIPSICIILGTMLWFIHGRDPKFIIPVEISSPDQISPAEAGYIIDGIADNDDVASMLVYWASLGYMRIDEHKKNAFKFIKLKDIADKRPAYERKFFKAIFKDDTEVDEKTAKERIGNAIVSFKTSLEMRYASGKRALIEKKSEKVSSFIMGLAAVCLVSASVFLWLYTSLLNAVIFGLFTMIPVLLMKSIITTALSYGRRRRKFTNMIFIIIISSLFVLTWMIYSGLAMDRDSISSWKLALMIFGGGYLMVASHYAKKMTGYGHRIFERVLGFRMFMNTAHKERLEELARDNPSFFYDRMPYALALGVSRAWIGKFADIVTTPPSWYSGYHYNSFNPIYFGRSITRTAVSVSTPAKASQYTSGYRPGGSSFSSGGGFSGGGFGGGGGGSW